MMSMEEGRATITKTKTKIMYENNHNNFHNHNHIHGHGNSPRKSIQFTKIVSNLDWRLILILFTSLFLILLYFSSYGGNTDQFNFIFQKQPRYYSPRKAELTRSKMAVCLVGGARRFELTGPSIIERILTEFPNSDLFLNSPIDENSFKLSLLKFAPRIKWIRIFKPKSIPETDSQLHVLTAANSPNGIQEKGFTYDWIVRTRVDGYWSNPLDTDSFIPGEYVVPPGSSFGGLNDRLGVGDYNTSVVALSRLSLIPTLEKLNYTELNSETAFKAQLASHNISYRALPQPFCIVTDRKYTFPPGHVGVPVAGLSSRGPLNGVKCRPCKPICVGPCVEEVMSGLGKGWSWTPWRNDTIELCDAHSKWEVGWEKVFDKAVGKRLAQFRKRVKSLNFKQCVKDFMLIKRRAEKWDTLPLEEICKLGLGKKKLG
ncbi:Dipeptidyl peptidase family member 2 [Bienertia sinuspersici]